MSKPKKSLEQTIRDDMPEFAEEVQGITEVELNERLAQLAKDAEAVNDAQDADEDLQEARDKASQLNAPYVDSKKAVRLRSRYIILLLKQRKGEIV